MKIDPYLSPYTTFKSKSIKDLNIKQDTLTLIEEKNGKAPQTHWHWGKFLNFLKRTPMAHALRSKITKWDLKAARLRT